MIKLFKPYISIYAKRFVDYVLSGTQLAEGPLVRRFEQEFERKFRVKNAVAVNSGTSSLELAYELANIKEGDEVITPVMTCTATNLPLVRRRAKIIFADILGGFNINPDDVEARITKKTKAIVFVHFGGNNEGLKDILKLGAKHKITIIEDAAQAVGSDYWGKADFTAVSFQAIKTLTTGDGGMLLCKKKSDYKKARLLRWFGIDRPKKQKFGDVDIKLAGYKYHMNDIAAAIGLGNLKDLDKIIVHRKKIANIYNNAGLDIKSYVWLCLGFCYSNRDRFIKYMKKNGVEVGLYHYRNDKYTVFGGRRNDLGNMDYFEDKYFILPFHHDVSENQAKKICKLIHDSFEGNRKTLSVR